MFEPQEDNDPIREYQANVQRLVERAERLRPILKSCEEAIQRSGVKASVKVGQKDVGNPKVEVMLFCKSLDETVSLFRELAKEGLKTDKVASHKDHNILDIFAMREYNLGPDLTIMAMVLPAKNDDPAAGPRCRMEVVGVKEVPIYEMKCD